MLTANQLCVRKALRLGDFRARLQRIKGGSIDTELKELTVRPIGCPSSPTEVTMTTPVVNDPSILRSLRGLKVCKDGAGSIPMERLYAPARTREELRALMNGDLGTAAGRGDLVHLALRLIVAEALEGEVSDGLGRERYERGEGEKAGYRNGYRPGKMKTAEGAVDYSAPQVRDTPEPFVSSVRAALSGRTRELERLAVELYARGLSTRDIEDTFTDETGRRLLSRAAVSEITEKLWAEYEDFCKRDLSEHAIAYLFVDGIAERLRPGQRREAVLAAWGIGEDGRKSLLGLMAGSREDVETVRAFFQDLRARGLGDPRLVVR